MINSKFLKVFFLFSLIFTMSIPMTVSFAQTPAELAELQYLNEQESVTSMSSNSTNEDITKNVLGQTETPTAQGITKKIQQKGAQIIMIIQEFGKQIVIAALIMSFIVMAIGALGNPSLTGKAVTSAIICVIMYIAIEYGPTIGDMALNFMKS